MNELEQFFKSLQKDRPSLTNACTGSDFEENLTNRLKKIGFSQIIRDEKLYPELCDYLDDIKPLILAKTGSTLLNNALSKRGHHYKNFFVRQPYGSQNFPDFLIFTSNKIFSIESKYSCNQGAKPTWNSNLPKKDAIYIFGSYGKKTLTFFRGEFILPENERTYLNDFFEKTENVMDDFIAEYKTKHQFTTF